MIRLLAQRVAQAAVIVAFVATISFVLIHLAPGDPFSAALENPNVTEELRDQLRGQYGLDKPLTEQFRLYAAQLAHADLGWSFSHERPVRAVLASALPNTLLLMGVALFGSFALGILVALVQVARRGSVIDRLLDGLSLVLSSMPDFWFAILAL
ncbi:MAG: ABC transporter permease, partial [Gemmatimonadaceae bacterium]|nr:ABC transporter permease [Gemmatimonadaceae bacterium]